MRPPKDLPPARSALHVGELVTQRGDAACSESFGHLGHEGVVHASARAVREHVAGTRIRRRQQQPRHVLPRIDGDDHIGSVRMGHAADTWVEADCRACA
jgi:hypothetical protein